MLISVSIATTLTPAGGSTPAAAAVADAAGAGAAAAIDAAARMSSLHTRLLAREATPAPLLQIVLLGDSHLLRGVLAKTGAKLGVKSAQHAEDSYIFAPIAPPPLCRLGWRNWRN